MKKAKIKFIDRKEHLKITKKKSTSLNAFYINKNLIQMNNYDFEKVKDFLKSGGDFYFFAPADEYEFIEDKNVTKISDKDHCFLLVNIKNKNDYDFYFDNESFYYDIESRYDLSYVDKNIYVEVVGSYVGKYSKYGAPIIGVRVARKNKNIFLKQLNYTKEKRKSNKEKKEKSFLKKTENSKKRFDDMCNFLDCNEIEYYDSSSSDNSSFYIHLDDEIFSSRVVRKEKIFFKNVEKIEYVKTNSMRFSNHRKGLSHRNLKSGSDVIYDSLDISNNSDLNFYKKKIKDFYEKSSIEKSSIEKSSIEKIKVSAL